MTLGRVRFGGARRGFCVWGQLQERSLCIEVGMGHVLPVPSTRIGTGADTCCAVQNDGQAGRDGSMEPTQRLAASARHTAVDAYWGTTKHLWLAPHSLAQAVACSLWVAAGSWGRRGAGGEGAGRAVDAVCAAVHRWWPVRGGVGLASGGSAPESDGECAEESFLWLIS